MSVIKKNQTKQEKLKKLKGGKHFFHSVVTVSGKSDTALTEL